MRKLIKTTFLLVAFMAATINLQAQNWETPTDFQNRLTPKRLPMVQADNSGKPLTSWKAVADRQAIINQVTAYSFLIDEGRWDAWYDLFSEDILFETTAPCFGTIRVKGKEAFKRFVDVRFRGPGSETNRVAHRHTMGNVHVAAQTDTTAEVRTYMLISNAFPDGKFQWTTGPYQPCAEALEPCKQFPSLCVQKRPRIYSGRCRALFQRGQRYGQGNPGDAA